MGLFSLGIQQQLQAVSSGARSYPEVSTGSKNQVIGDAFDRETLQPTGYPNIYTLVSNDSNGTAVLQTSGNLRLTTDSSAIGDDVDLRMSELNYTRNTGIPLDEPSSQLEYETTFRVISITDSEGFIGLIGASHAALSALPTTAVHMGMFWDVSVGANYILSSADGTTQTTTDSGVALEAGINRAIRIIWSGANSGTIDLLLTSDRSVLATQTVTALNNTVKFTNHWFAQTEATAAKSLDVPAWYARWT